MNKKTRSFKKELIYSFLTIVLASITLLGIFQIFQLSTLVKESQENQVQTTRFLEDYIINYVEEHRNAIETAALNIKEPFFEKDMENIQLHLKNIKDNYPGFVNLYVGNSNGMSIVFYPKTSEDGMSIDNYDFSDRSYYKKLVHEKETVISSVFLGRGGTDKKLITITSPILNEKDELEGYVLGALDLTALAEHIENRNFGEEGYAIVLDQDHNVIVHPVYGSKSELVNLSDNKIVRYINEQYSDNGGNYFTNSNNGEKEYITFEKIHVFGDWTVLIANSATVISNTYKRAITTILIFILITAIIMVGASLAFSNRIDKMIYNLLNYIQDYTEGFREKRFNIKQFSGPKEMEELSLYFNKMIKEIENNRAELITLNSELEARVQERTANLKSKNLELKAVNKLITSVSIEKDFAHFIQRCLNEIEPFMVYKVHVLFRDLAVTTTNISKNIQFHQYLTETMTGSKQHMEPIQIDTNHRGFIVVDLNSDQTLSTTDQEFLQTFARSLSIVLQNKFLFERFRHKHAELESVLQSMSEGIMLLNNDGQVEYVNDFFLEVVSCKSSDSSLTGLKEVFEKFHELFDVSQEELSEFFNQDQGDIKLEYKNQSGKPHFYILHKFTVRNEDEAIGEGLLLRDITKEAEVETLKDNLISLTSHEFKTPITNIKGSVETLLRSDVQWEPEFQQELLEGVHEDIERIQHLVNDWMDISKIGAGTMYIERNMIRADHVIEESMDQIPSALRENATINFQNNTEENLLFYADKRRVQQVLVNLFTNALRYNDEEQKKIHITLDKEDDYITISVSDNGIGISKDHLERIFNRFYQVDVTATRRRGGTGLGLAICEGIMEAHEGKIEVVSEPNEGSTFTLYFPVRSGS